MNALLIAYILLQIGIAGNLHGWSSLVFLFTSFIFLSIGAKRSRISFKGAELALAFLFLIHAVVPSLAYDNQILYPFTSIISLLFAIILVVQIAFPSAQLRRFIFVAGISYAVVLYVLIPVVSPLPPIDVFLMAQQSAHRLLNGVNPYTVPISYIELKEQIGYSQIPGYMYLPGSLLLQTVGLLFGDVRWMSIFSMFTSAFVLWHLGKRRIPEKAYLLPLLFLFQTRGMYLVELAWVEPLLLAMLFLALQSRYAGFFLGIFLSLKQYLIFFIFHIILLGKRTASIGLAVAALIIIPFVFWDAYAWYVSVVDFVLVMGHRPDALNIPTRFGLELPRYYSLIVGGIISLITLRIFWSYERPLGFLFAATISIFATFLFGSQAFINYYIFVGGMILLTAVLTSSSHE